MTSGTTYQNQDVRIARLAEQTPVIEECVFEGCRILGPAMLLTQGLTQFRGFQLESADVFVTVADDAMLLGVVAVKSCLFENCRFERISIIGPRRIIDRFKRHLGID